MYYKPVIFPIFSFHIHAASRVFDNNLITIPQSAAV
jgi:hypothetical protein